ncbi:Uncharacterised protein [Mycobacteroides abscessus subsp. massiliense]|nr:Uncharacterised protein [Mycobacteroides abscessus subsp. massiliense]
MGSGIKCTLLRLSQNVVKVKFELDVTFVTGVNYASR